MSCQVNRFIQNLKKYQPVMSEIVATRPIAGQRPGTTGLRAYTAGSRVALAGAQRVCEYRGS